MESEPTIDQQAAQAPPAGPAHAKDPELIIEHVSGWILRLGVIVAMSVILLGIALSIAHRDVPLARMRAASFEYRPADIWHGLRQLSGQAVIELGIYLLVATPIMRVATSMVLFIITERDWFYAAVTAGVLLLTLAGLLLLK
jgi:uncharacterized protein